MQDAGWRGGCRYRYRCKQQEDLRRERRCLRQYGKVGVKDLYRVDEIRFD